MIFEFTATEQKIKQEFRYPDAEFDYLLSLLAVHGLELRLKKDGKGCLIDLIVTATGQVFTPSTTEYLLAEKPLSGFIIGGKHPKDSTLDEKYPEIEARRQKNTVRFQEETGSSAEYLFYVPAILERVRDNLTAQTLPPLTGLEPRDVDYFIHVLKQYNLKLRMEFLGQIVVILFENEYGSYVPLPTDESFEGFCKITQATEPDKKWNEWRQFVLEKKPHQLAGFAFKKDLETESFQPLTKDEQKSISQEYKLVTGIENCFFVHYGENFSTDRFRSYLNLLNPAHTEQVEPPNGSFKNRGRKAKKSSHLYPEKEANLYHTPVERHHWVEELVPEMMRVLLPHLHAHNLDLINAKELIQPGQSEAVAKNIFDADVPFPIVDFLIVHCDQPAIELAYPSIMGWKKDPQNPDNPSKLIPYGNVCGIVLIPDELPLSARKKITREASLQITRNYPTHPNPMVLTVTPKLIETWKQLDTVVEPDLSGEDMLAAGISAKQAVDYGHHYINKNEPPKVSVHTYEPLTTHIGGTQLKVVVDWGQNVQRHILLDYGWIFDLVPTWSSLGAMPRPQDGLDLFLRSGMFEMTNRLYRLDLLLASLNGSVLETCINLSKNHRNRQALSYLNLEEFFVVEIFHRLGEEAFVNHLRVTFPEYLQRLSRKGGLLPFLEYLQERQKVLYQVKTIYDLSFLSHAHQDHSLGIALLNPDIPIGWSAITRALCAADHRMASNWLAQDVAFVKLRSEPKVGAAYQVRERAHIIFNDGDRKEVSPGVFVTAIEVKHSIPGAFGALVEVEHLGKRIASIAYPGDYKDGRFFEEVGKAGGTDFLFVEGTNPPSAKKKSKFVTEADVARLLDEDFKRANKEGKLIVIDVPKNSFERLENIRLLCLKHGRNLTISPKMLRRLRIVNTAVIHQKLLPELQPTNPAIRAWKPLKVRYSKDERDSFEAFGPADRNQIFKRPEWYVIVRESEAPEKLAGLGEDVVWIDSTYGPYTEAARQEKAHRRRFAKERGWEHIEGRHASGHTPVVRADSDLAEFSAPAKLKLANAKRILPIHTQKPGEIAEVLEGFIDQAVSSIIKRRGHPIDTFEIN